MAGTASRLTITVIAAALICGCAHWKRSPSVPRLTALPVAEAPAVPLPAVPQPTVSAVSAQYVPAMIFVDGRPDYEKHYYPGETDPHRWRDAVAMLPMESFQPGLKELLKTELLSRLEAPSDNRTVRCTVTSFQVALDERLRGEEDLLYEYRQWDDERERTEEKRRQRKLQQEQQEREAKAMYRRLGFPDASGRRDDGDEVGDQIMKGLLNAAVVKPIKKQRLRQETAERLAAAPQTLPAEITDGKFSGWNCAIDVLLEVTSVDGTVKTQTLTSRVHQSKNVKQPVQQQMQSIVQQAVQGLAQKNEAR
ncbi:MAG: hypothetical protein R3C59_05490 [Planctomycetaceae bacterium]